MPDGRKTEILPRAEQSHQGSWLPLAIAERAQAQPGQPQEVARAEAAAGAAAELKVDLAAVDLDQRIPPLSGLVRALTSGPKDDDANVEARRHGPTEQIEAFTATLVLDHRARARPGSAAARMQGTYGHRRW